MKVAFDEHVPAGMARVFTTLATERRFRASGVALVLARDFAPKPDDRDYERASDVPWLERFVQSGGRFVISGDVRMMENPHEIDAIRSLGLVVALFEGRWGQWDFYRKSALLLWYWQTILKTLKSSPTATVWRIPSTFPNEPKLRDISPGRRQMTSTNTVRRKPSTNAPPKDAGRQPRNTLPDDDRQGQLHLPAPRSPKSSK